MYEYGEYMKILFISLGCDKNTVDSEMMLGILSQHGYEITDSEDDADAAVILLQPVEQLRGPVCR